MAARTLVRNHLHNVVLLTIAVFAACAMCKEGIHNQMSIDELRHVFHVESHHHVPDYEVVHIKHQIRRRSIDHINPNQNLDQNQRQPSKVHNEKTTYYDKKPSFKDDPTVSATRRNATEHKLQLIAFGRQFTLRLRPTEGLIRPSGLRVFTVEPNVTAQHGVDYVEVKQPENEHIGDIYQDEENEAAILMHRDDVTKSYLMEGSIGKDLVVRPLPERLRHDDLSDDEMFLDADDLASEVSIDTGRPLRRRTTRHVIYKRSTPISDDTLGDYAFMEPDHLGKRYRRAATEDTIKSRNKREAPYVIYPEILVIVDYDGYRLHGGDNLQIKRYFVSFWNGVDMRYKLLKGPKIRISIAGIIISRGRDATPYLEKNRVGRDAIDSAAALTDMGKYLFKERRLPVYDIAVAITKLDMCRRQYANDVCNRGTAGFAYVGGACVVNKRLEKVNSVAIIEDTGGFSGIIVAAHEVGHLLGAVHDGSPPPSYLGGPGAEKCRWEDGFIMSDLRHTERGFRWSPCSVQSFHHFLNGDTATCLFNAPHEDENLARVLPGKLLSLDAQCRKDRGTSACFKDDRVCAQLFCFDSGSGYCVAYRPAAEGSICGDGQYCLDGRCVAEHENIIPDYSQNTPSYVRASAIGAQRRIDTTRNATQINGYYTTEEPAPPPSSTQYNYDYYNQYQTTRAFSANPNFNSQTTTTYYPTTTPASVHSINPYSFKFSLGTTTRSPYDFHSYIKQNTQTATPYTHKTNPTTTTTTTKTPYIYRQPPSTTKNEWNHHSTTTTSTSNNYYSTTKNPYIGDYYNKIATTTKNPYNFANFGKSAGGLSTTTQSPYTLGLSTSKGHYDLGYHTSKNPYNFGYSSTKTLHEFGYSTTRSPYDFSGGNNYLKRSPNYYSDASSAFNARAGVDPARTGR